MATFRVSAYRYMPDDSGEVYEESAGRTRSSAPWKTTVFIFNNSGTVDGLHFKITVPQNYVNTANLIIIWTSSATSSNVVWDFSYRSFGGDGTEDFNSSSAQETLTGKIDAAPGAAYRRMEFSITLTDGNFSAGDTVLCNLSRASNHASDGLAATVQLEDVFFEYSD